MCLFGKFSEVNSFVRILHSTFVVQFQRWGREDLKDLKLISLIGGLHQVLTNVLAKKLKSVVFFLSETKHVLILKSERMRNPSH